jgi:hypothetical protein
VELIQHTLAPLEGLIMGFWQKLFFNHKQNNTFDSTLNNEVTSNSNQEPIGDVTAKSDISFDDYWKNTPETENTFPNPYLEYDNELSDEEPLPGINM